ncbi:response regulator [Lampropedia puyangensis]|uniref:Virulence sensor protein BvgS n=1 Tax=Lampropedia puyangensis TaxID=1330072 RepID=A0A4S8EV68_9BURK|nr:hybrid sensor histidine kinase/response regulator [Lampropedia puyangensis]THT98767.1 response regulator [Lampropedia puyangensis]
MSPAHDLTSSQEPPQRAHGAALKLIVLSISVVFILCALVLSLASLASQQIQNRAGNDQQLLRAIALTQRAQDIVLGLSSLQMPITAISAEQPLQLGSEWLNRSHQLVWTLDDLVFLLEQEHIQVEDIAQAQHHAFALRKAIQATAPQINNQPPISQAQDIKNLTQSINLKLVSTRVFLQERLDTSLHTGMRNYTHELQWWSLGLTTVLLVSCAGLCILIWRWWQRPYSALANALHHLARKDPGGLIEQSQAVDIPAALTAELLILSDLIADGNRLALQAAQQAIGSRVSQQLFELAKTIPGVVFQYEYLSEGTRICHFVSPKVRDFFSSELIPAAPTAAIDTHAEWDFPLVSMQTHDLPVPLGLTRSLYEQIFAAARTDEESLTYDTALHTDQGAQWVRTLATVAHHPNGSVIVNGVWLDVTENIEQAEALARARNTAEQIAEEKARLLAVMSHEIRTPLNGILGMAQLALKSELSARQSDRVEKILSSGHHLMSIVNDILDFSKIESGRVALESTPFSLQQIVADVSDLLAPRAAEKGLEFWTEVPFHLEDHLQGDPYRIRQILINFVANAIKFTPSGEVSVQVRLIETTPQTVTLRFDVRDTGIGVSSEDQKKLFQAFRQADVSTTRKYGGTGLGLAISSHFAQLLGGQTGVESQPGQGSLFWFSAVIDRIAQPPQQSFPALEAQKVLLIESHTPTRNALRDLLVQAFHCSVTAVHSGQAALRALEQENAHPQELDFQLCLIAPTLIDGEATHFIQSFRQQGLLQATTWLMAPAESIENEMALAPLGVTRILPKPVNLITLQKAAHPDSPLALRNDAILPPCPQPIILQTSTTAPLIADTDDDVIRLLVVDDNALNRTIAGDLLQGRQDLNIHVDFAEDGQAAIAAVTTEKSPQYDAILMDLQMPQLDGFSATQAIRSASFGQTTPIFAMSAHHGEPEQTAAINSGVNGFIHKPIMEAQLWETLEQWQIVPALSDASSPQPAATAVSPEQTSAPSIDPQAWQELTQSLPLARAIALAERFLEQSQEHMAAAKVAAAKQDFQQVQSLMHQISGTAGTFGLLELGAEAGALSDTLRNHPAPPPDVQMRLEQIDACALSSHAALRNWIAQTTPAQDT